jgi:hypothetical protein
MKSWLLGAVAALGLALPLAPQSASAAAVVVPTATVQTVACVRHVGHRGFRARYGYRPYGRVWVHRGYRYHGHRGHRR